MIIDTDEVFWVYQIGRYVLSELRCGRGIKRVDEVVLPEIFMFYEEDLRELNINYEQDGNMLLIYDPEVVEWEDLKAPIYSTCASQVSSDSLEMYTGKIPTDNMLQAAQTYYKQARKRIDERKRLIEKMDFENSFFIQSEDGISVWWEDSAQNFFHETQMDSSKYFLFNLAFPGDFFDGLVIYKAALKGKKDITLRVPKRTISRVIGKDGATIKRLTKELRLRRITVKSCRED